MGRSGLRHARRRRPRRIGATIAVLGFGIGGMLGCAQRLSRRRGARGCRKMQRFGRMRRLREVARPRCLGSIGRRHGLGHMRRQFGFRRIGPVRDRGERGLRSPRRHSGGIGQPIAVLGLLLRRKVGRSGLRHARRRRPRRIGATIAVLGFGIGGMLGCAQRLSRRRGARGCRKMQRFGRMRRLREVARPRCLGSIGRRHGLGHMRRQFGFRRIDPVRDRSGRGLRSPRRRPRRIGQPIAVLGFLRRREIGRSGLRHARRRRPRRIGAAIAVLGFGIGGKLGCAQRLSRARCARGCRKMQRFRRMRCLCKCGGPRRFGGIGSGHGCGNMRRPLSFRSFRRISPVRDRSGEGRARRRPCRICQPIAVLGFLRRREMG